MRRMIWLHKKDDRILVNPDLIESVFPRTDGGSYVFFTREDEALIVDEKPEEIDRLISLG